MSCVIQGNGTFTVGVALTEAWRGELARSAARVHQDDGSTGVGDGAEEPHHRPVPCVAAAQVRPGAARWIDDDDPVHARDEVREDVRPVGARGHPQLAVEGGELGREGERVARGVVEERRERFRPRRACPARERADVHGDTRPATVEFLQRERKLGGFDKFGL